MQIKLEIFEVSKLHELDGVVTRAFTVEERSPELNFKQENTMRIGEVAAGSSANRFNIEVGGTVVKVNDIGAALLRGFCCKNRL